MSAALELLPTFMTQVMWKTIRCKYRYALGGDLPSWLLKSITRELLSDRSKISTDEQALNERLVQYAIAHGDDELWPDLRATLSGWKEEFSVFYQTAEDYVVSVSGATAYCTGMETALSCCLQDLFPWHNGGKWQETSLHGRIVVIFNWHGARQGTMEWKIFMRGSPREKSSSSIPKSSSSHS
jgi:hypothetical protein